MTTESDSFPRRHARTQRFTLGAPRSFTVAPDGSRVVFLRSHSGTDRANALWVLDPADGAERPAADPYALLGGAAEDLSAEERARRERSREGARASSPTPPTVPWSWPLSPCRADCSPPTCGPGRPVNCPPPHR